jgi:serine/threonine-protein kinase
MGVVYLALQCSVKRPVALKMILMGLHADPAVRVRFRTEAEAVARLQHPNIVQIYELGEKDGRPFLSLEYIDGCSLLQKVAGTPQPEQEAARLVETLARAVHYSHQRGILHRDLKPSNVLLTADGTPKVTDFGLAKVLDAEAGPTRAGSLLGTPSYMAPEQAAGDTTNVGASADVYSLGAILYELLTGRAPFRGATPLITLDQVKNQEPVPPRHVRRSVSPDLETICLKCLDKEPGKRYSSAEGLADDLRRFMDRQPIRARPVPRWKRMWRSVRRHPARAAYSLGAAALVCLLVTAWFHASAADEQARHRAEENYRRFAECRDEALLYGLLAPDDGALFLGSEVPANLQKSESAAREALALAPDLPAHRKSDAASDCYALLLVLASIRGQRPESARYEEALKLLERARQLGFRTRAYQCRRAHFLDLLGRQQEARKEWDEAVSLTPEGALDYFLIGEEQYRHGHWREAINAFDRALDLQPAHFWARFFLAVCHLKTRRWEAAKAGLNACLAQRPDFVWGYLFRSFANERMQTRPEAEADFENALRLNPNEDARYVLFLTRGILHFNDSEPERAAADFRSAAALKPGQYNAYLNLAQVYLSQERFEQAEAQFRMALRLGPPTQVAAGYHVERGRALLRKERYEEALQASADALELSRDQPWPYEVSGQALLALGRHEQAEDAFDRYLKNAGEEKPDIFLSRGLARMKRGKCPEAAEDYTRALERVPDANIFQHRGWAYFFSDAWKMALRDFSKAIELDPDAGDAYTGRGLARVMLGHYQEAVADAEAALRRRPRTPEMMHNIACIFAQAIARAEADLQAVDRQSLADSYHRRSLEAVRQTLALLPPEDRRAFWRNKILADVSLTPIRNDTDFKRLAEEYDRH